MFGFEARLSITDFCREFAFIVGSIRSWDARP